MQNFIRQNRFVLVGLGLGLVIVYTLAYLVVQNRLEKFVTAVDTDIMEESIVLRNLAEQIGRGGVNETALSIMPDCTVTERTLFDNRLSRLETGLSQTELKELDTLFSRCAPVSVIRRSVMVLSLKQSVETFAHLINQRKMLNDNPKDDAELSLWERLLTTEQAINKLSFDLVFLQKEIIDALMVGLSLNSSAADELRKKGQELRNELIPLTEEAAKIRQTLLTI